MSLRIASLSVALFALGLLSACALRPRYKDMVRPEGSAQEVVDGQTLTMRVVDPATGQPIKGAKVVAGSTRMRVDATSDADGRISVPFLQTLLDENPLVEVVLPKGVKAYQFQVIRPAETPAPQAPAAPEGAGSTGSEAPASSSAPETSPSTPETQPAPPPSTSTPGT